MKKSLTKSLMLILVVAGLCAAGSAEAGILNTVGVSDIVEVINSSEPSIAWGVDLISEESVTTATVSLVTYSNRDLALGSLRAGYAGKELDQPDAIIGAIELVTPNIVRRFIPEQFKDWKANLKVLSLIPSVSVFGGYVTDDDEVDEGKRWAAGVSVGPKVTF